MMRVPHHWTAEQAFLFTDFLGDVLQAIWDQHDAAIVDVIVEHGRVSGGVESRVGPPGCSRIGPLRQRGRGEDLPDPTGGGGVREEVG